MPFKVTVKIDDWNLRIYVNGLPHIVIDRKEYIGFHSYYEGTNRCLIEWHTKTTKMVSEYDDVKKWQAVLKSLDQKL